MVSLDLLLLYQKIRETKYKEFYELLNVALLQNMMRLYSYDEEESNVHQIMFH